MVQKYTGRPYSTPAGLETAREGVKAFPYAWLVFFSLTAWGLLATLSRVFMVGVLLKGLSPDDSKFSVFQERRVNIRFVVFLLLTFKEVSEWQNQ